MGRNLLLILLSISSISTILTNTSSLLIKIPTRSRPTQLFKCLDIYYKRLSNTIPYHFLITCDRNDETMYKTEIINKLKEYPNLTVRFGNSRSKVEAYNQDIDEFMNRYDIVLVASDDMVPIVKNYDTIIVQHMLESFPDYDGVLHFNDGHTGQLLNTMPVIGKKYFQRFGYIYHPEYTSVCCDLELTIVSKILRKAKYIDQVIIEHRHPAWGKAPFDALYLYNEQFLDKDKAVLAKHRNAFFNIDTAKVEEENNILLSILICTLRERRSSFNRLYNQLIEQINECGLQDNVEVLYFADNREHSVGFKRNTLLSQAQGKYICFIDDDDTIDNNYIRLITSALLETNPDCVSLTGVITFDGKDPHTFIHSIKFKKYFKRKDVYYRPPNHLNPIRRIIGVQFTFPATNHGEDTDWAMQIANTGLLKNEVLIEQPYYFYRYNSKKRK